MLAVMNNKGPILALLVIVAGLGVALMVVMNGASDQKKAAADSAANSSNTIVIVKKQLGELLMVNQTLETNLAEARSDASNKLALAEANLRATEANLEKVAADAKAEAKAQADSNAVVLAQRDQKISELESQKTALDKEADSLHAAITDLNSRITDTQSKLAKSEGDRAALTRELKKMMAEREDMQKRFNDLVAVREQLRKLKMEAAIDHRLDKMRRGIDETFQEKSAGVSVQPPPSGPPPAGSGATVELRQGGGVKIQTSPDTNAPPK
jgi:uncharacterized phage infection (PIP) family protein YhgE